MARKQAEFALSADSGMLSVVTRRNLWGGLALLVFATVAMYVLNPFRVASWLSAAT
jgi:hypothetical protein